MPRIISYRTVVAFVIAFGMNAATALAADTYPSRPIRLIVPYAPGGTTDILARILGQKMTEAWGQQVVIDNRPGGGGIIGSVLVAKANPDGYTLLMATNGTHAINVSLYSKMPYDAVKDFAPITLVAQVPLLLVTHPKVPARTVSELIAFVKSRPGQANFGSASAGSSGHLAGEMLNIFAGIKAQHVPYKGDAPALADLIGGQITHMFANMPAAVQHVRAGKLHALAVTTPKRSPAMLEVPTMVESSVAGFEVIPWYGLMTAAQTPPSILSRLNSEVGGALNLPDVKERLASLGAEGLGSSAERFSRQIASDIAKYAKVIKESGARID